MNIKIGGRLHPFSHVPGITCLIPRSLYSVEIFPVLLRLNGITLKLPLQGPIREFTVEQDLEKGVIRVFGHTPQGYMCYLISKKEEGILIHFEKAPPGTQKEMWIALSDSEKGSLVQERLSLGMHRSQEWEMICKRGDLREIFPFLLRLSQMLPKLSQTHSSYLLEQLEHVRKDKNAIVATFLDFFRVHFYGMLMPRLFDNQFQGIAPEEEFPENFSPLFLLKEAGEYIRSLFIQEEGHQVEILPFLPPEFHAGRFTNIHLMSGDQIDFEWSKKLLRRLIWRPSTDRRVFLKLQKPLVSYRLRRSLKERGERHLQEEPLILKANEILYLDRFQK